MAGSVNKVILIGNLGRDPEVRTMQNGARVCNLSIATGESWKDKNTGERREKTEWHRVVIFNEALIGLSEKYLNKGSKVYIEGQIETRKWTADAGKDNYSTEVVLRPYRGELTFLDSRNDNAGGGFAPQNQMGGQSQGQVQGGGSAAPALDAAPASLDDLDDDIPF